MGRASLSPNLYFYQLQWIWTNRPEFCRCAKVGLSNPRNLEISIVNADSGPLGTLFESVLH